MSSNVYKAEGSARRKQVYTGGIVLGAVVLAALIVMGYLTIDQIEDFVDLAIRLVGLLGGIGALVAGALARKNVDPPETNGA